MALLRFLAVLIVLCCWLLSAAHAQIPSEVKRALALRDYSEAVIWLEEHQSDPDAAFELARLYQQGRGVQESAGKALALFLSAAESGHREAQYVLGRYFERQGDLQQAEDWMTRAAALGHRRAESWAPPRQTAQPVDLVSQIRANGIPTVTISRDAVNSADTSGSTPLMLAVELGAVSWLEPLLDAGAMVDAADRHGATALHRAAQAGNAEAVSILLQAGADPDPADEHGNRPLHLAVAGESVPVISLLLDSNADPAIENDAGWSAEALARRSGEKGLRMVFGLSESGRSQPDIADQETLVRRLSDAAIREDSVALNELLKQAVFSPELSGLAGLLTRLAETGATEPLEQLLLAGVPADKADARGRTALHAAAAGGNADCIEVLVQHGADLNGPDPQARTPILLAARSGSKRSVHVLMDAGADVGATDREGRNALWWALRSSNEPLARFLLDQGVPVESDLEGVGPMHLAAEADLSGLIGEIAGRASIDDPTGGGNTALLIGAGNGSANAVLSLIEHGADLAFRNEAGDTALIIATRASHLDVARILLQQGANPNTRNDRFESATDIVVERGDAEWRALMDAHERGVLDLLGAR